MKIIFITGIGTDVGKTIVAAVITKALHADYWKPIQAGKEDGTDANRVSKLINDSSIKIHPELYALNTPSSPHIAARIDQVKIDLDYIVQNIPKTNNNYLIIEGAGGIMVPLNEEEFVIDLISRLNATVILVSKNYLGSINHSLLTAAMCKQRNIPVAGWIFNDQFMQYESEIAAWTGYPSLQSIPFCTDMNDKFIAEQASIFKQKHPDGI